MVKIAKSHAAPAPAPRIESVRPSAALPGGEIEVLGSHLGAMGLARPTALLGEAAAHILLSRPDRIVVQTPAEMAPGGDKLTIQQRGVSSNVIDVQVARMVADGVHAVGNPAVDASGNIFVTYSGPRGQTSPVSVFRIDGQGEPQSFLTGLINATGLAFDQAGYLYVSSRQEGTVHRVSPAGAASLYSEGMGVATGLAFDAGGNLYVGDRSGTIFKIGADRQIFVFATLEPSVAAYHLAFGPGGTLYVTGPTTSSYDSVYAIDTHGAPRVYYRGLGRPQGLAVDRTGNVYVAASYRGRRGIFRVTGEGEIAMVVAGSGIAGLAFAPGGDMVVATSDTVYRLHLGIAGFEGALAGGLKS
ncbi:MAG TPA: gluconolaconase [Acidisarcina sp.]